MQNLEGAFIISANEELDKMSLTDDCAICAAKKSGGDDLVVYEDALWRVRHSSETNILAYLIIESKRHFLDLSEARPAEQESFGPVTGAMIKAIRAVTLAERVYNFSLGEAVPHFHTHLIPRTDSMPRIYRGRGVLSYPLLPQANQALLSSVCDRLRIMVRRYQLTV